MNTFQHTRRRFLAGAAVLPALPMLALGDDRRPAVDNPRATDGDDRFQPHWDKALTITVGPKKADLVGTGDKVIQAAVDYVARLGGGTVKILPGTYTLRNSVYLPSGIRIVGSGLDSVVTKGPSVESAVAEDSDWYDQEITLTDAKGFRVGDGVTIQTANPHNGGKDVIKRTLVARSHNRFKLSDGLRKNVWLSGKPTVSTIFPLFTSERAADVVIENLTFDGNKAQNANLNGNYGGCVFLQDCNRFTFRNVTTRNYNGDGVSFQVCHDVVVEDCHSHDNADLGVHPGSGSQRPVIRANKLERNRIGLFWCWGVKYGLAEGNTIDSNRNYGVSIGHNDTDNVMRDNDIKNSGKVGVLFRDESRGKDFWPNRNVLENNRIIDNGPDDGVAIDVQGKTKDVRILNNQIRETRQPMNRIGVRISPQSERITLRDNSIEGFAIDVQRQTG